MKKIINSIKRLKLCFLIILLFILNLNSCYFTYSSYSNISSYTKPGFRLFYSDTLYLTNLIYPDTIITANAIKHLEESLIKLNSIKITNAATTTIKLRNQKFYSLFYNLETEQLEQLYNILKSKYILVWYLSRLEETGVGKDGMAEIVFDIYDLNQKVKTWSCKSRLNLSSPQPKETPYLYTVTSSNSAIDDLIDNVIKNEISKILLFQ